MRKYTKNLMKKELIEQLKLYQLIDERNGKYYSSSTSGEEISIELKKIILHLNKLVK